MKNINDLWDRLFQSPPMPMQNRHTPSKRKQMSDRMEIDFNIMSSYFYDQYGDMLYYIQQNNCTNTIKQIIKKCINNDSKVRT